MVDHVPDDGNPRAPIVLIDEAPGHWEMVYGRPFVGPSYTDKLLPWWNACGLKREDFYITNVLDYQPAKIDRVPQPEMHEAMQRLRGRLASLPGPDGNGPVLIVPTGNYALYATTGHGRVAFHARDGRHLRPGISEWRGSILSYQGDNGRVTKLIPTIHPAATFRNPLHERRCRADWLRIAADAKFRELRLPKRTHLIAPSLSEVREYIAWTRGEAAKRDVNDYSVRDDGECVRLEMSIDVETPRKISWETRQKESTAANGKCRGCGHTKRWHAEKSCSEIHPTCDVFHPDGHNPCAGLRGKGGCSCPGFAPLLSKPKRIKIEEDPYLGCIGYSWDPKLSLTIPTTLAYWQDSAVLAAVMEEIRGLHVDENIDKVMQNGSFDSYWCATEGIPIAAFRWDTMDMHRVEVPGDDQHDLAYQASLDTREPYWKDEAKDPDSIARYATNNEALWTYNGKDNCVQRELGPIRRRGLMAAGRLDFYLRMSQPMIEPLGELSLHGIRTDGPGRAAEFDRVTIEAAALAKDINEVAGEPIMATKVVSTKKMKHFLYESLRLPLQYAKNAKKQKVISTDIVAIRRLMEQFPGLEQLQVVGAKVLQHRRLGTIKGFVKDDHVDPDGRMRAQFVQDTIFARIKSRKNPRGTGRNLQNIDRKLRQYYLPDEG